jgi:hypothetical protein
LDEMMRTRMFDRRPGLIAAIAAIAAVAVQFSPVGASSATGPSPATTHAVTLTASPVDNLVDGAAITYTVNTSGGTTLIGNLTAHICIHGLSGYTTGSFGYSGANGVRCVYNPGTLGVVPGIVSGGLNQADYESTHTYAGTETTSGPLTFHAGTGSVLWGNVTGQGPLNITCDSTHPCDLVIEVNLAGDGVPTTYFVQPLAYAGAGATTTTASTTVPGSTTTTVPSGTTTTTVGQETTTTVPSDTTTTTVGQETTTTVPSDTTTTTVGQETTTTVPSDTTTTTVAPETTTTIGPETTTTVEQETTTTVAQDTTTTVPATTTTLPSDTTTTVPATTTTFSTSGTTVSTTTTLPFGSDSLGSGSGSSGGSGSLPFTGSESKNVLSVALLSLSSGMLLLGRSRRTRARRYGD